MGDLKTVLHPVQKMPMCAGGVSIYVVQMDDNSYRILCRQIGNLYSFWRKMTISTQYCKLHDVRRSDRQSISGQSAHEQDG